MIHSKTKVIIIIFIIFISYTSVANGFEPELGEPTYSLIDENHVNALTKSIYYRLDDVGIGHGSFALNHSITLNSTNMLNHGAFLYSTPRHWGYKDKFIGGIYRTMHTDNSYFGKNDFYNIHVYDDVASYQFYINDAGLFEPMADKLISLEVQNDRRGFILTRADGVKVYFSTSENTTVPTIINKDYEPYGIMTKIENPNGLIVKIHRSSPVYNIEAPIKSVTTNNGLQLKYIYEDDNRSVPSSTQQKLNEAGKKNFALSFSQRMPRRIIALNNAVERCPLLAKACNLQNNWPTVEYTWPIAVPYSMYVEPTVFTVKEASGLVTDFFHYPHSKGAGFYVPRINKIKNSKGYEVNYSYQGNNYNAPTLSSYNLILKQQRESGILNASQGKGGNVSYQVAGYPLGPYSGSGPLVYNISGAYKGLLKFINTYKKSTQFYDDRYAVSTAPYEIETWEKIVYLDQDFENKVNKVKSKLDGATTYYTYDEFGRLKEINRDGIYKTIYYPYSYTGFCDNYRFCHKPSAISQPYNKGLSEESVLTLYKYHPSSGNISKVTNPANYQGKKSETIFKYQQYYARYINDEGKLTTSTEGIWQLASQFSCKNSNVTSGASCSGGDKITTTYNYGTGSAGNNLFLIGKTINTQGETNVYRTCYKYDRFGNRIGETQPKAGVMNCNVGREF